MADENEARVYGMADQANRDPPAAEGMRGEKASAEQADLDFSHPVTLDDGRTVTVSEGSGVAYTEATGRAGTASHDAASPDQPAVPSQRGKTALILAGLAAGIAGGAWLARRLLSRRPPGEEGRDAEAMPPRLVVIRRTPRVSFWVSRI